MPFLTIPEIHTADPSDKAAPKRVFKPDDPFSIVMRVLTSSDVVEAGLTFNGVWQMVNPRLDPLETIWYIERSRGELEFSDTIDWHFNKIPFDSGTDFFSAVSFNHYSDAVSHIQGPDRDKGIFFVRGTIDVLGSDLFDQSPQFVYKVRPP